MNRAMRRKDPMKDPRVSDDRIHTGFSWYPEAWPESEWPADIARMREVGITMVRLGDLESGV